MLKLHLWLIRVILEHLHPLNKLKLNLVFLWLKIPWLIILMGMLFISVMKLRGLLNPILKDKHRPVVGMPVICVKIGDHCYHSLCDVGASVSAIPFTLYQEVMNDIAPTKIEDIDVTIKLANTDTISPVGIVRDVEVLCGKIKYPTDFLFLVPHKIIFVPSYLVDPS